MPYRLRDSLQQQLEVWGQNHVLERLQALDELERRRLARQLEALDLAAASRASLAGPEAPIGTLLPPEVERHPTRGGRADLHGEAHAAGESELAEGRVAILLVAGGEGTRLGHDGPKGTFPIGPVSDRSLFGLFAQQLRALGRRFGHTPPWAVMTSPGNDLATRRAFAEQDFFGLEESSVLFFCQAEAPCLDAAGQLLFAARDRILTSPEGHGGVLPALVRSGVCADLAEREVVHLFHHQVDNPLVPVGDPTLVGFRVIRGCEIASKVIAKRASDERVGTWASTGNGPRVVEYTELPATLGRETDASGALRLWAGSINVHVLGRELVERVAAEAASALPYHASPKPLRALDADGRHIELDGFKLERFVFDAVPMAKACVLVEALREREYAPVKSASGAESPASARGALDRRDRAWLAEAGLSAPEGLPIELDLSVFDGPEAVRRRGLGSIEEAGEAILTAGAGPS